MVKDEGYSPKQVFNVDDTTYPTKFQIIITPLSVFLIFTWRESSDLRGERTRRPPPGPPQNRNRIHRFY
jgi:hypothetical protein